MTRVYLKLVNGDWQESETPTDFWLDSILYQKLKGLDKIRKKGWDAVILIDGKERSGKSTLGLIMGWYLSRGKMTLKNLASGLFDAARKIGEVEDGGIIQMDEGSLIFDSKSVMSKQQQALKKLMDIVGQKNLVFIIVLPSFFDLSKTMAVRRSLFLCHVYPDREYNRGQFLYYGERRKSILYREGKKRGDTYRVVEPDYPAGEFFDFKPPFYEEYTEIIKKQSLREALALAREATKSKIDMGIKSAIIEGHIYWWLKNFKGMSLREISRIRNIESSRVSKVIKIFEAYKLQKDTE